MRSSRSSARARSSSSGTTPPASARSVTSKPSREGSRRATNPSARLDAGSSHCTSSTATSTGCWPQAPSGLQRTLLPSSAGQPAPRDRRAAMPPPARDPVEGQHRSSLLEHNTDEISQRPVRERRLGLGGLRAENLEGTSLAAAIASCQRDVLPSPPRPRSGVPPDRAPPDRESAPRRRAPPRDRLRPRQPAPHSGFIDCTTAPVHVPSALVGGTP